MRKRRTKNPLDRTMRKENERKAKEKVKAKLRQWGMSMPSNPRTISRFAHVRRCECSYCVAPYRRERVGLWCQEELATT